MDQLKLKKEAAAKALEFVESGMRVGLGSGSTAAEFVKLLGEKVMSGGLKDIVCVSTSVGTEELAKSVGLVLSSLNDVDELDVVVDGADEVDSDFQLIKGLGRALLREKMTEIHTDNFIVVVDESKIVKKLGSKGFLPVEVVPFAYESTIRWIDGVFENCRVEHWVEDDGKPAMTDNGNFLLKLWFDDGIDDPYILADVLGLRPGVVCHGLFLDMASVVIVAKESGVEVLEK